MSNEMKSDQCKSDAAFGDSLDVRCTIVQLGGCCDCFRMSGLCCRHKRPLHLCSPVLTHESRLYQHIKPETSVQPLSNFIEVWQFSLYMRKENAPPLLNNKAGGILGGNLRGQSE